MTIFLGCGFAAKYPEGGGNYSVPLQWMLGLRRLGLDAIWLELLPATKDRREDESRIRIFQRRLREHGLENAYCLLYQNPANDGHDLAAMRCVGLSREQLRQASADELHATMDAYVAYFGTYTVDAAKGLVVHHVTGDVRREYTDTDQERPFRITGDELLIGDGKSWLRRLVRVK